MPAAAIKSVSNFHPFGKSQYFWCEFQSAVREDVQGVAWAGEIIKQAVIDGILMEEDGSISNISRF